MGDVIDIYSVLKRKIIISFALYYFHFPSHSNIFNTKYVIQKSPHRIPQRYILRRNPHNLPVTPAAPWHRSLHLRLRLSHLRLLEKQRPGWKVLLFQWHPFSLRLHQRRLVRGMEYSHREGSNRMVRMQSGAIPREHCNQNGKL